ncbi:Hsp20/alpha crystallin family protein [Sulfurimonas autotrophica]|uniref:Heat shock protein Hsp20 n=1 Tax=Sulfurimonas autotrophica (strain ATCC BAA-671 / DSM 16294 / JCM 11897 / OK10) TaxID=563040 RepID=E0UTR0_SULAO|nr:Hsp20/alpha crystallin family protein [Sulfurimonas autotrophica]ADN08291.1 heat shock protein Hsp20 [Sulfurimonas autotrophica DSM 16294]
MKKILSSVLLSSLLAGSAFAVSVNEMNPYDADFAKMNQYFSSLLESHLSASALNNFSYPRTDIQDLKDTIILKFDLAGVEKKNIKLSIDDNKILTLEGEKKESKEQKSKEFVKKEIFYGSFKKAIQLPENIDENKLQTKFENGILTVTIPKTEIKKQKAKLIPIK